MTGSDTATSRVFLVWHNHTPEDDDNAKLLGVFSSREKAEERVVRARLKPGFADFPDDFIIAENVVDKDEWTSGFVRLDSERWVAEGWGAAIPSVADQAAEPSSDAT